MLIDVPATYYSDVEKEGIRGVFNATKDGIIYMTPKNIQLSALLINMIAYRQINPEPVGEDTIKMMNITSSTKKGFPITIQFDSKRDMILSQLQNLINETNTNIDINNEDPVSLKAQDESSEDNHQDGEAGEDTFTEFPSFVLETKSGESEEEILFNEEAKLYIISKDQWLFLGAGEFHIDYSQNRYRIVMRRGPSKIISINQWITKELRPQMLANCFFQFLGHVNQLEKPMPVLVKFNSIESLEIVDFLVNTAINAAE